MIANHPRLSVNGNTLYEKPATCNSVPSTVPCNYTYENTPTCTHTFKKTWKTTKFLSLLFVTYFYHQNAQIFCHNIHKNSSQFLKSGQFRKTIIPKQPNGDTVVNLIKYIRSVLPCTVVHLSHSVLQNDLSLCTHNSLIYYIRTFLRLSLHY